MTITKTSKLAKLMLSKAHDIRCFSLSNNFSGQPLAEKPVVWGERGKFNESLPLIEVSQQDFLARELNSRHAKLTVGTCGKYHIRVHANLWYEFLAEV